MIYFYILSWFIFLVLSYKFTIIENSFLHLSPTKKEKLIDDGIDVKYIEKLNKDGKIYSTTLIGDYFSNGLSIIFLSMTFYKAFGNRFLYLGCILGIFFIILFGESLPKHIAKKNYESVIEKNKNFTIFIFYFLKPLVFFIRLLLSGIFKIFKINWSYKEPLMTEDDLKDAVSISLKEGIIDKSEVGIIENVMGFRDSFAKDIMTPRTDIVALDVNSTYEEIAKTIKEENFSRMPVYEDDLDNILGILYVKDLFSKTFTGSLKDNLDLLKQPYYTFEYKPIANLFNEMRHKKISIAIVSDEYGGTEGMISTEDLIEKIVGEINDEYDEEEDMDFIKLAPNKYLVDGSMNVEDLGHLLNKDFETEEFDSVAGYIIENIDRFPKKGEDIILNNIKFHIAEASKNRIDKIIVDINKNN